MEQATIAGTSGRRRHGTTRAATERTLTAWSKAGHLTGPESAAARAALRSSADAVDAAAAGCRAARELGDPGKGAHTWSTASRVYADLVVLFSPAGSDDRAVERFLEQLGAPALSDT